MTLADISQIRRRWGQRRLLPPPFRRISDPAKHDATRAASHHAVSEALNQINLLWARNKEVARIWLAGLSDRRALTPEERGA